MKLLALLLATYLTITAFSISIPLNNGILAVTAGYSVSIFIGTPPQRM